VVNVAFYIARRYLFAKKSHNIINIVSIISVLGIAAGTMALIIVLSVFNGFENLVADLFNTFNPDIRIEAAEGKTFNIDSFPIQQLKNIDGISCYTEVIEENALLKYKDKQYIVTIKGVSSDFNCTSDLNKSIVEGEYRLEAGNTDFAVVGQGIAYNLGLSLNDFENPLAVYVPKRSSSKTIDPMDAFNMLEIQPSGYFGIQQDFDLKYVIVPLRFTRELLDYPSRLSSIELKFASGVNPKKVQKEIKNLLGPRFTVKNRFEQEEILFKIMKSEKLAVFMILTFILIIATFNVVGSLSMLILDKKKDIAVLKSLGAKTSLVRRIFMTEGMLISLSGAVIGLLLGFVICFLQQTFGFIKIGNSGSFLVEAYPVKIVITDFIWVLLIDVVVGFVAAWYPVRYISQRYFKEKLT
jgi:lipoprotein-releasing system permease protein